MEANLEAEFEPVTVTIPYMGGYNEKSIKKFANYIADASRVVCDQKGFYMSFAAFVVEDDQPFTMGEKPGIKRVFDYVNCKFSLPTDTTCHSYVSHLHKKMHAYVVDELTVCNGIES
jgi:hypothetical protein